MYILVIPLLLLLLLVIGLFFIFKKRYLIALVLVGASIALNFVSETFAFKSLYSSGTYSGKRIRVMSYNIHNNGVYFDKHPESIDSLMRFIEKVNPDIIFLTEYWKYKSPQIATMLHDRYPYCSAYVFDKPDKTDYFLCSRYPISNVHRFHKQGLQQMLVHGMDVEIDGVRVKLIGCHLQSNNLSAKQRRMNGGTYWSNLRYGYETRQRQVERIRDSVESYQCPTIVMGDMNDISGSYTLRTLKKAGLKDAWWESGLGYGATYVSSCMKWRIDHILYSNDFEARNVWVPDEPFSDHDPIVADLYIKNLLEIR